MTVGDGFTMNAAVFAVVTASTQVINTSSALIAVVDLGLLMFLHMLV